MDFGQKEVYKNAGRCASLAAVLLILSILQCTPGWFPTAFGAKAYLLIPAVVSISLFEKDIGGIFFGLFAGALWDVNAGGNDLHAILLVTAGFVCGSLLNNIMRSNIMTDLILTSASMAVFCIAEWLVKYIFGGLDSAFHALLTYYLPSFIYTVILSPVIFVIVFAIESAFSRDTAIHRGLDRIGVVEQ